MRRPVADAIPLHAERAASEHDMAQVRSGWLVARLSRCDDDAAAEEIRRGLVLANLGRAERIARRYRHRGVAEKRLRLIAFDALVEATRRFDPALGTDFLSYSGAMVRGAVRRQVHEQAPAGRWTAALGVPGDVDGDPLGPSEAQVVLARVVPCLAPRDRHILELRFFDGMSEDEVADLLGLRPVQVSHAARRIVRQLRVALGRPLRLVGAEQAGEGDR
jgi:RNA polymerase sigma factor (sigma-70 family)